jgi:purine nucleoside phosphorylase
MPEAGLARELGLNYAPLAVGVNWAAGIGRGDIHAEIEAFIAKGILRVQAVLQHALPLLAETVRRAR